MDSQNPFPAFNVDENNNIANDIEMSGAFDGEGICTGLAQFDNIDLTDVFDFGERSIDPKLSNYIDFDDDIDDGGMGTGSVAFDNEADVGGTKDSPATGGNKHNPSEVDNNGKQFSSVQFCADY